MNLEDILDLLESSDGEGDHATGGQSPERPKEHPPDRNVDYTELYNELIREGSSYTSDEPESPRPVSPNISSAAGNDATKTKEPGALTEETSAKVPAPELGLDAVGPVPASNAADGNTIPNFENDFDPPESANIAKEPAPASGSSFSGDSADPCQCDVDTKLLIKEATSNCGNCFSSVKQCVEMQLAEWENRHKLHLMHKLRLKRGLMGQPSPSSDSNPANDKPDSRETQSPDICKTFLRNMGLPSSSLAEDSQANKLTIRCRHKLSSALESLRIFEDRFYPIEESSIHRLAKAANLVTPTCMCTSADLVAFGTMCGSVFVAEFSLHNHERKFCSYNEYEAAEPEPDPLNWYEVDAEKGISVTSLDILPNTGWIAVGYSDGSVKLLQNFKVSRPAKGQAAAKGEGAEAKPTDSRAFGLMADAVSSAFSGIKKASSQTLCSTDVFNDSVLNCKFTFAESYEEIVCSNLRNIAILTYSKNVLSHNLNVNYLQTLNERLESDQIVDIVCLAANPQAKFITGGEVGGICAILTCKTCFIFTTRPRPSIILNVSLDKLNRGLTPDPSQVPSFTWMIFNSGKKNIKPLLLISHGNQIRFIQCNLQTAKGAPTMNAANMGTIHFSCPIRCIRIVTRLILAVVDYNNTIHIIQINLTAPQMYYDVVRTVDLAEACAKMELGVEVFDPLWLVQTSILSTVAVFSKTVKMAAKGYKKFSNLVSDLFQGKKHTSSFELKNFSVLVLVPNGVLGLEINSWVKVIGELSASKLFSEALALVNALAEEWIPGLYDFRAFKNNLNQLVLYILHQSSAHIIKLAKFANESQTISTNLLNLDSDPPKDDFWNSKVKSEVYEQINTLCCSMIDSCVAASLYEPLNDLIFRCFATIDLEHVFVKYILLNFYHNRIGLQFLNSQIIESICHTYEAVLDDMYAHFLHAHCHVEDEMMHVAEAVKNAQRNCAAGGEAGLCSGVSAWVERVDDSSLGGLVGSFQLDPRALAYHIICNNLAKIQLYCFKNNVITETNKAVSRLSRHCSWHSLIYCHSVVLDDYSGVLNTILNHAHTKCRHILNKANERADERARRATLPLAVSENLFAVRVLFLALESFLTFEGCGLMDTFDPGTYANLLSFLSTTELFKPSFPVEAAPMYARSTPGYDAAVVDYDRVDSQAFAHDLKNPENSVVYKLLTISPRLFFVCLSHLFLRCSEKIALHANAIGTKLALFNFLMNVVVSSVYRLEQDLGREPVAFLRRMTAFLFLSVAANSDALHLTFNTTVVAIYTLLTAPDDEDFSPPLSARAEHSKELANSDGYFNSGYFQAVFYAADETPSHEQLMLVTAGAVEQLVFKYLTKVILSICANAKSTSELAQNPQFMQLFKMCTHLVGLTSGRLRFFFYQITGNFNGIIQNYDSLGRDQNIFDYLDECIRHITKQQQQADTVDQLLLLDSTIRRNLVAAIMKNLPMLIKLDLNKVTNLLIDVFSLMDVIKTLDSSLETSPDTVLNTLEELPDLQLLVLDALLKSRSTGGNLIQLPNSYFNRYLNLLSVHDKANVANFLRRQKTLDINHCLRVCRENNIEDALIYLLVRAGNLEEALDLILVSFANSVPTNPTACYALVEAAHDICRDHHDQISYEVVERLWFAMLRASVEALNDPRGRDAPNGAGLQDALKPLIEEIFTAGILKYVDFPTALLEITKYDATLHLFKAPLHSLMADFQLQTYAANSASTISKLVMNREFRSRQVSNGRGVVISAGRSSKLSASQTCAVCGKTLILSAPSGHETPGKSQKAGRKPKSHLPEDSKLHAFEEHVGLVSHVPIQGDKPAPGPGANTLLTGLHNDRLSTFLSSRTRVPRAFASGIQPSHIHPLVRDLDPVPRDPIIVYWCRHSFHVACAPASCPLCNTSW